MHPLFAGLAFVGGLVAGYFIGHYVAKCKCEEEKETALLAMDDYYRKKAGKDKVATEEATSAPDRVEVQTMDVDYKKPEYHDYTVHYEAGTANPIPTIDPAEYESPSEDLSSDENLEERARSIGEMYNDIHQKERNKPPRVISAAEHGTREHEGYLSVELLYYTGNDTLVLSDPEGDEETLIRSDELDDLVGNTLTKFGFKTNDENVTYVRNYQRMWDMEITKVRGDFCGD